MIQLNWNRTVLALAAATFSAVVTFNVIGVILNPCRTSLNECAPLLGILIPTELAIAMLVALPALPIYLLMYSAKLICWWHFMLAGGSVSALGGYCIGFVKLEPAFEIQSLLLFLTMGMVAGLVFWLIVRSKR